MGSISSNMNNTEFRFMVTSIALALLCAPLMGCIGPGEEENAMVQTDQTEEFAEWGVYYAENIDDLPECNDLHVGKLYYLNEDSRFGNLRW